MHLGDIETSLYYLNILLTDYVTKTVASPNCRTMRRIRGCLIGGLAFVFLDMLFYTFLYSMDYPATSVNNELSFEYDPSRMAGYPQTTKEDLPTNLAVLQLASVQIPTPEIPRKEIPPRTVLQKVAQPIVFPSKEESTKKVIPKVVPSSKIRSILGQTKKPPANGVPSKDNQTKVVPSKEETPKESPPKVSPQKISPPKLSPLNVASQKVVPLKAAQGKAVKNKEVQPKVVPTNRKLENSTQKQTKHAEVVKQGPETSKNSPNATLKPFCDTNVTYDEYYSSKRVKVVNPFNHNIILAPNASYCDSEAHAVILVMSLHDHITRRDAIRETWGNWYRNYYADVRSTNRTILNSKSITHLVKNIKLLFVFGKHKYHTMNTQIQIESSIHGDLIQGDFKEKYDNLPLKNLLAYKWIMSSCKAAKYVFKIDDDFYGNVPLLVDSMERHSSNAKLVGRCNGPKKVMRTRSKNAISCREYPLDMYPKYLNGNPGYILATDILPKLYEVSTFYPFLSVEDVVFTGILPNRLNIDRSCDPSMRPSTIDKYGGRKFNARAKFFHAISSEITVLIWDSFLDR